MMEREIIIGESQQMKRISGQYGEYDKMKDRWKQQNKGRNEDCP